MKRAVATNERDESGQAAKTVADAIYANLRRDLLNGKWPPGSPLRSAALRLAYGVGISPLREALTRLVGDRLVTVEGQRGFRVAPVSLAELQDVMRLRADLEAMALRAAIDRGDVAWEETIRTAFEALADAPAPGGDPEAWEARHAAFHRALVGACGSPWLQHFRGVLEDQSIRYRRLRARADTESGIRRDNLREHQDLMTAVLARDAAAAEALMRAHLGRTATMAAEAAGLKP